MIRLHLIFNTHKAFERAVEKVRKDYPGKYITGHIVGETRESGRLSLSMRLTWDNLDLMLEEAKNSETISGSIEVQIQ